MRTLKAASNVAGRLHNGLPFPVEIPNAVTRQTFEKTDRGEDLHDYPSLDDFFKKMGA